MQEILISDFLKQYSNRPQDKIVDLLDIELPTKVSIVFDIPGKFTFRLADWSQVKFCIKSTQVTINFVKCTFKNVTFRSSKKPALNFENCSFIEDSSFIGWFNNIKFSYSHRLDGLTFVETATVVALVSEESRKFENSHFYGKFHRWITPNCTFKNCIWRPKITDYANVKNCKFPECEVTISDWLNVCEDKSGVDFKIAKKVNDNWAKLRDDYTGARLYIILLFTAGFFMPYAAKSLMLMLSSYTKVDIVVGKHTLAEALFFGKYTGWWSVAYCALGGILVSYNVARFIFTLAVAKKREREEHLNQIGFNINRPSENELKPYMIWHKILTWLYWLSVGVFLFRVGEALFTDVPAL